MTTAARRWLGRLLGLDLLLLAALVAWVVAQAVPSSEAVRLRNALLFEGVETPARLAWSPAAAPADFRREAVPPPPLFSAVAGKLALEREPDDWSRAQAIARHLQGRLEDRGPIMAGLEETYRRIMDNGEGYCGDYADVFSALAAAAGLATRQWSFSFDGYGGHGHIFNEVWDAAAGQWRAIDIYNNYLFVDRKSGRPLSALEFRAALRGEGPPARIVPLNPAARPGFALPEKSEDYYRRGAAQWYLWWGNAVATVDGHPLVRAAGHLSRHLEQLAGIAAGVQPGLRVVATPESLSEVEALSRLAVRLRGAALAGGILAALALGLAAARRRHRGEESPALPRPGAFRLAVVGPLPPPSGGMANQCRQLARLLRGEGLAVEVVQTNAPYRPRWVGKLPVVRAAFRLLPYLAALWRAAGRNDLFHVFANSGWAWHLCAAPAIAVAHLRGVPVVVNYRGGNADAFLARAPGHVRRLLGSGAALVAPSGFLRDVFARHGLAAAIVPNIVDLHRFSMKAPGAPGDAPLLLVTRNLEPIYDIPTAIRAFARVREVHPGARLTIAGSGPERGRCERLVAELGMAEAVTFAGRIDNDHIAALYAQADVAVNPSTVDNMPISILEAYASGVPVVSTDVGGIPYVAGHERTALLVPPGDPEAMAAAVLRLLADRELALRLTREGAVQARGYAWPAVREQWLAVYRAALAPRTVRLQEAP